MEAGAPQQRPQPQPAQTNRSRPNLTVPQMLAFCAFVFFALLAMSAGEEVNGQEIAEMATLTMFLIGALLPSDALIRLGRNLLFQTIDDPDRAAKYAPATTLAQVLGFATYLVVGLLTYIKEVNADEFREVSEVARVLIVALLPSDAGIRFGRALYYRADSTPQPGIAQLKRI